MASSRSEQYEESWSILKKAQRNFDHLFLQQKVNHGLGKKSNEYPKI